MNWIDCKIRKPTAADGDPVGRVFARTQTGGVDAMLWAVIQSHHVAWMPIPEYVPVPDPPEGYEILTDYDAEPDPEARYWHKQRNEWVLRPFKSDAYTPRDIYAVPVKPPEPKYRPFANAEEFRPFRERWWRNKASDHVHPPGYYNNTTYCGSHWEYRFKNSEFEDGTPFGMPVGGDE